MNGGLKIGELARRAALSALFWSVAAGAPAATLTTETDGVRVELTSDPEKPMTNRKTIYSVRLVDTGGKPVTGARVTLTGRMADGMSAAAPLRASGEPGIDRGELLFTMNGRWDLTVRVIQQDRRVEIPVQEEVAR